ncbi:hypothetical protein [Bradyrhizobium erythrophlei]|jgi:hypothetical protein|uniref:Uncharacterized protein n=1 Tax=Bradyrhizobium erythrophlei TaxID=1437360 RepID=A0A1M5TKA5_9BRAD|nr:hypothetical protein [Bradyrhizobium erythrophlei]SHH51245.1 hypothetical protein SAMN05443248_5057 [Bradyrhizobium erythrophlei]
MPFPPASQALSRFTVLDLTRRKHIQGVGDFFAAPGKVQRFP